jgi:hypothetical protein
VTVVLVTPGDAAPEGAVEAELDPDVVVVVALLADGVEEQALATRATTAAPTRTTAVPFRLGLAMAPWAAIDRVRLKASTDPPLVSPVTDSLPAVRQLVTPPP